MPKVYRGRKHGSLLLVSGTRVINGDYDLGCNDGNYNILNGYEDIYDYVMECPTNFKGNYNYALEVAENIMNKKMKITIRQDIIDKSKKWKAENFQNNPRDWAFNCVVSLAISEALGGKKVLTIPTAALIDGRNYPLPEEATRIVRLADRGKYEETSFEFEYDPT